MYFSDGDILLESGRYVYSLIANDSSVIEYDIESKKIVSKDTMFLFRAKDGNETVYKASAIINFKGVSDSLEDFANTSLDESNIPFKDSTHELINQIMDFYKDNLVNVYLDSKNYDELRKLSLILESK